MVSWIALIGALFSTALGQAFFKYSFQMKKNTYLAIAIGFFVVTPLLSYIALQRLYISTVYMSTAVTQVIILGLSRFFLKEELTKDHFVAITFILLGVIIFSVN
ncbi:MAG: EamA family transporter [Anaerolineales bacterium]|nr:EamA family transporter [Anaerolineales bacterium]